MWTFNLKSGADDITFKFHDESLESQVLAQIRQIENDVIMGPGDWENPMSWTYAKALVNEHGKLSPLISNAIASVARMRRVGWTNVGNGSTHFSAYQRYAQHSMKNTIMFSRFLKDLHEASIRANKQYGMMSYTILYYDKNFNERGV